jgi:hypothetical protein
MRTRPRRLAPTTCSVLALALALVAGCAVEDDLLDSELDHERAAPEVDAAAHADDPVYDGGDADLTALFATGAWDPSPEVRAAGRAQYVAYTEAGPWNGGDGCTGSLRSGTRAVGDYVLGRWAPVTYYGGYACRQNTADLSQLSMHGTGRALDIMLPLVGGTADNEVGDRIAGFLIRHAEELGVQYIIWDRASWGASRSLPKVRPYTGPHPHDDHLHVELSPEGAAGRTAWFAP